MAGAEDRKGMEDARFEDADERPLRLRAQEPEDLDVISSLAQDAVATLGDFAWMRSRRRFAMLINRFRWEDAAAGARRAERVRSLLQIEDVKRVRASGVDPSEKETVVSLLAITFTPGEDGAGELLITLAGDGELMVEVECLDLTLTDVTRPYSAPSGRAPEHRLD